MPDFTKWTSKTSSPNSLYLDEHNPRLREGVPKLTQRDLLHELLAHNNVDKLCEDIAAHGYFPTEVLVGVAEEGKTIVIEGNRRLAALKLLLNPSLSPESYQSKMKSWAKLAELPAKVPITITPDRESAVPLLLSRHTQTPIERWTPAMQANYVKSLIDEGMSSRDVSVKHNIPQAKIDDLLHMDYLYKMACGVDVSPEAQVIVRDPHSFPLTNLERLMTSTDVREWMGISRTAGGKYTSKSSRPDFEKAFGKIVEDVALGNVDSRKTGTNKKIQKYLKTIDEYKPSRRTKGGFDPSVLIGEIGGAEPKPKEKNTAPSRRRGLFPRGLTCSNTSARIAKVFEEMKSLPIHKKPNTSAVMLRVLSELALSDYLERTGGMKEIIDGVKEKNKKKNQRTPRDFHPSFTVMLEYFIDNGPVEGAPLKALRKLSSDSYLNADTLHAFVHNPSMLPTERELESLCERLLPMLKVTLNPAADE